MIDFTAAAFATLFVFVAGHLIKYFIDKGEDKQWKRSLEKRFDEHKEKQDEMSAAIQKLQEIHTLERLNNQQLNKLTEDFKEHKDMSEIRFVELSRKIDGVVVKVVETLGKLAER